jgi:DNA-binding response OmpR family regulator
MGLRTEADDYIDKPVEPAELVRRVEALIAS